ncbi:MAG: glycerol kinase GlpK [bacterium]
MKKYILSIDQGTTGSRAVIYDKNGRQVAAAYREFPQYFPQAGWVEHNPEEIWRSVTQTIQTVLKRVSSKSIAAIGITNQRETTVMWDKDTGKPVCNAIVWQCRRTADRCGQIKNKKNEAQFIKKRTGLPVDAYFSATKIEWILKHVPQAQEKAKKGKILFGTTDTWILWKLTGGRVHATDYTNASRTMLFNIKKLQWDQDILQKFNIPERVLPAVKKSSSSFGRTVQINNLPAGIPITGIAGDQQAALFGQTCFEPGSIKNTYGTGCFMLLNTGKKCVFSKYGLITTIGCGLKGEPVYVLEGAVFIAGAAIQWLRDGLHILAKASDSEKMALRINNTDGVYFVPALVGLGAPYWDQQARGAILGITRGTTQNHIVRAALEAVCYQTRDVLEAMQKDTGLKIGDLKIDGGASANNFMCQFQADILHINVKRPRVIEITSLGAAYLAGLAVGFWKNANAIKKCWQVDRQFKPRMNKKLSETLYKDWVKAVARTRL